MGVECPKCHFDNPDDTVYCGKCATPLPSSKEIPVTETLETPKEELTTGSTFAGRYQIIEVLGKGGMGKVYRALDKKLNEEVALKLIKPEIASDKKTLERFNNELKFARKISHKNVGRMYELMEEKGTHFITMEYVPGQDLRGLIRQSGQLAVGTAVSIAKQMCEGLTAAHRLGVIHRDLKPQNIMIDKEGNARIMDFGIARSVSGKGITGAGVMVGTPEYMSPEQVESKETDQRSDIYSLGVILYEMVTGRVPFEGDTPLSVAVKHKTEDPLDPKQVNTQIPEDLSHLILRCMEKDKEKRYQSAGEVRSELENIEKGIPTTEKVILKRKPITSREITVQFNLKKIFIPALVILVLIATALVFLWKKGLKLESNRVVVTAFLNQTGDPNLDFLGRRTADMVSQGLKAIGAVEVAPIASFDLGQERKVEEKHYRRIAKNTKAAIVIAGEYYQQGENLAFHSNIYNAKEQKLSPSPEPISGQRVDPSQALERLRNNLMSVVLSLHNPQMETWLTISTYIPKYEALVEFIKGMEFFMRRKYEASIECCDRAIEIDPNYTLSHIVAAVAHNNLRRYSTTAQYLEKVKQIPNLSQGERNLRDWLDAHLKGDNESKFRITQRQEKLAPGTSHSYQLGLDAIRTNRPHIAIEALTRLDPEGVHMKDWISYWGVLRSAYHMIGNHKQELKAALKAQKQYPESWSPLGYKIDALAALGNLDKVYKVLEECKAKPMTSLWNPANLMNRAGIEFRAHGYSEEAVEMFEQALSWLKQRPPEDAQSNDTKYLLAAALYFTQNLSEAESILRDLCELNPERLDYLGCLGIVLARKGDRKEALWISEQLKNWNKPYLFGRNTFWQAAIAAALGEKEKAIVLLRTAISQGQRYSGLYCNWALEPLWDYPAFIELLKPRD